MWMELNEMQKDKDAFKNIQNDLRHWSVIQMSFAEATTPWSIPVDSEVFFLLIPKNNTMCKKFV